MPGWKEALRRATSFDGNTTVRPADIEYQMENRYKRSSPVYNVGGQIVDPVMPPIGYGKRPTRTSSDISPALPAGDAQAPDVQVPTTPTAPQREMTLKEAMTAPKRTMAPTATLPEDEPGALEKTYAQMEDEIARGSSGISGKFSWMGLLRNVLQGAQIGGVASGGQGGGYLGGALAGLAGGALPGKAWEEARRQRNVSDYRSRVEGQYAPKLKIAEQVDVLRDKREGRRLQTLNAQAQLSNAETNRLNQIGNEKQRDRKNEQFERKFAFDQAKAEFSQIMAVVESERKQNRADAAMRLGWANLSERQIQNAWDMYKAEIEAQARGESGDEYDRVLDAEQKRIDAAGLTASERNSAMDAAKARAAEAQKSYAGRRMADLIRKYAARFSPEGSPTTGGSPAPAAPTQSAPKTNAPAKSGSSGKGKMKSATRQGIDAVIGQ